MRSTSSRQKRTSTRLQKQEDKKTNWLGTMTSRQDTEDRVKLFDTVGNGVVDPDPPCFWTSRSGSVIICKDQDLNPNLSIIKQK